MEKYIVSNTKSESLIKLGLKEYEIEFGYIHINVEGEKGGVHLTTRKYLYIDLEDTDLVWNLITNYNKLLDFETIKSIGMDTIEIKQNYKHRDEKEIGNDCDHNNNYYIWFDVYFVSMNEFEGYSLDPILIRP